MGQSTHDAVKVPFVLPAEVSNEGQFAFSVDSIAQPSKMKGTLTYMLKVTMVTTSFYLLKATLKLLKFSSRLQSL